MGKMLGAFDNPEELDRPDLNKCPDCECYFAGDNCPLCGKECPPEMRAGVRKPPKKQKAKRKRSSSRSYFIEWYHRWWFIALAMFVFPLAGIVLLITSPHKKSSKIAFVAIGVAYLIVSTIGLGTIIGTVSEWLDPPVDTSLSRDQYVTTCRMVSPEDFYRSSEKYNDKHISITLVVKEIIKDGESAYSEVKYPTYYVCEDPNDARFTVLVRNCLQGDPKNLAVGDVVTVYGEGAGSVTVYDMDYLAHTAPCINAAYAVLTLPQAD
jgi:hypothetical protein